MDAVSKRVEFKYVIFLKDDNIDMSKINDWCCKQFGKHLANDRNGVWFSSKWIGEGVRFSFLNERDYMLFVLRWA
jgi:hypothetical protein